MASHTLAPFPEVPDMLASLKTELRHRAFYWPASDRLRDELAALGVTVTDTPDGQTWAVRPTI